MHAPLWPSSLSLRPRPLAVLQHWHHPDSDRAPCPRLRLQRRSLESVGKVLRLVQLKHAPQEVSESTSDSPGSGSGIQAPRLRRILRLELCGKCCRFTDKSSIPGLRVSECGPASSRSWDCGEGPDNQERVGYSHIIATEYEASAGFGSSRQRHVQMRGVRAARHGWCMPRWRAQATRVQPRHRQRADSTVGKENRAHRAACSPQTAPGIKLTKTHRLGGRPS